MPTHAISMKSSFTVIAASILLASPVLQASIGFDIQGELLRTAPSTSQAVPTSTLVMLVADTAHNGFDAIVGQRSLSVGSLLNGDDQILLKSDLTSTDIAGVFADFQTFSLGGNWGPGDPLALVWMSTYTTLTGETVAGDSYGLYTSTVSGVDGSDAWITPADNANGHKLYFFTASAAIEHASGSNPDSAGEEAFVIVAAPEPAVFSLMLLGFFGIAGHRRR